MDIIPRRMGFNSEIGWTDDTANCWHGCTHAQSIGCDNCYAEVISHRWGRDIWGNDKPRMAIKSVANDFKRYQKIAVESGGILGKGIRLVFVGSMMDIFEKPFPLVDAKMKPILMDDGRQMTTGDLRDWYFNEVVPNTPNLIHLMLTKRPSNINKYIPESWKVNPPSNVMFGTSPVNQATADILIPQLLKVNGRRFLSVEPQLAELSLKQYLWRPKGQLVNDDRTGEAVINLYCHDCGSGGKYLKTACDNECSFKPIHWVINGGESGGHKRPFNADWARVLREECKVAKVPFFFKQMDKVQAIPDDLMINQFPEFKIAI